MIPGIVALLLLVITTNLSAMGIVREREVGTLEQLNVTPLRRSELIIGKLVPYALIGLIDVVLVLSVAVFWFQVPLRGSVVLLFGMTMVYLLSTLGLGLFVSTISSTQQQAMMTSVFFFLMPMVLLSGFVFPIENMPAVIQPITYLLPLRYFLVILRAIFMKGLDSNPGGRRRPRCSGGAVVILMLAIACDRANVQPEVPSRVSVVLTQRGGSCPRTAPPSSRKALVRPSLRASAGRRVRGHPLAAGYAVNTTLARWEISTLRTTASL